MNRFAEFRLNVNTEENITNGTNDGKDPNFLLGQGIKPNFVFGLDVSK